MCDQIESSRLFLKTIQQRDFDLFYQMLTDPFIRKYLCDDEIYGKDIIQGLLDSSLDTFSRENYGLWMLSEKVSGQQIGFAGLRTFFIKLKTMENKIGKTLRSGYLNVGDDQELFYETYGNPDGIDVLFLHGGPGVGCSDSDKRFFDPNIFHVIFLDQRGAPKSKPKGTLKHNTTQHLVEDINKLLDFLEIEKVIFFGGSWGTALSLVYAIQYPERVISMILRGIFLGIKEEIDHLFKRGGAVELFYPEAYDRFIQLVPEKERDRIPQFFLDKMLSEDPAIRKKYIYEWELFESSAIKLDNDPEATKAWLANNDDYGPSGKLVVFYSANNCFLEDDYILSNAHKIAHIPTSIVHGRYDIICPPIYAYKLKQQLNNAELFLVKAGHISSEPEIEKQLKIELGKHAKFAK